jgi:hypothetical protein
MKMKSTKAAFNNAFNRSQFLAVFKRISLQLLLVTAVTVNVRAQDPVLPPTNLGLANVFDGVAGKPGFVYMGYVQVFQTRAFYDQAGRKSPSDLKINSVLQLNQLLYLSPVKVLGGNLGFTVLVPIVQINSSSAGGPAPTTNPAVLGDPLVGTAVQWSDRKLLGKPFSHRLEFDVNVPAGDFDRHYNINPGGHLWNYEMYYAFTIMLNKRISVSSRSQLNYNSHYIGTEDKAGAFYNGNYSVDYSILPAFKIEAVAYYLTQLNQDSHGGDNHYYQDQFSIYDTKEHVLGYGPGIAYFSPRGILFEGKVFFETAAQNRFAGTRPTLRIVVPLSK